MATKSSKKSLKRRRPEATMELKPVIKTEFMETDDIIIKMEPPEPEYEMYLPQQLRSDIISNQSEKKHDLIEAEVGLVSELEFIKSEFDVDENMVKDLHAEIHSIRKGDLNQKNGVEIKQPVILVDKLNIPIETQEDKQSAPEVEEEEGDVPLVKKKKIIKCPYCDFQTTTRNRSYLLKDHMRKHTGETPYPCPYCPEKFSYNLTCLAHVKRSHPTKRVYRCLDCRIWIYKRDAYIDHKYSCVKIRSFECYLCKKTLKRVQMHNIRHHMRVAHTGEKTFSCDHCPETFVTRSTLSKHIQVHHPHIMKLSCSVCELRFNEMEKLIRHERNCKSRPRFECHLCGYTVLKLSHEALKQHMRKHTGVKPFKCCYCPKYFPRSEALAQHLQRHAEKYTFQCRRCHGRCIDANSLEKHELHCRRRRYECHLCGFTKFGISFSKFRRHVLKKHIGEGELKCVGCPRSFSSKNMLAKHVAINHPHLLGFQCAICNRQFKTKADRRSHQEQCTHKRFECYLCRTSSSTAQTLKTHMVRAHTNEARFPCSKCPRKFQIANNLKIHMNSHAKQNSLVKCDRCNQQFVDMKYKKKHEFVCKRVYECYLCKKTFPKFPNLHGEHMKTHLGEKPYDCRHCGRTIGSVRCYKLHVLNFHLESYRFQCNICRGYIKQRKDFRVHQKNCMKPIRQSANVIYFTCSMCGRGLKRLPDLRRHIEQSECKKHPLLKK